MYSFNLDSVLCYAALHNGAQEHILHKPMVIYHIEHEIGSGWSPEGEQTLNTRLEISGVPQLSNKQLIDLAIQMRQERKPRIFNDKDWGLNSENLSETRIS
jgi:hypothetical protein